MDDKTLKDIKSLQLSLKRHLINMNADYESSHVCIGKLDAFLTKLWRIAKDHDLTQLHAILNKIKLSVVQPAIRNNRLIS